METTEKPIEVKPDETVHNWEDLSDREHQLVAIVHAMQLKSKPEKVLRLLNVGHPKIVFGPQQKYCRIHHDSVAVMTVITNEYLHKAST